MADIQISSSSDFISFCGNPTSGSRLVFRTNRIILPPTGISLRNTSRITIAGETASLGRTLFTGGRFSVVGCQSVLISKVGFRSQRLRRPLPEGIFETYEKSWKPFTINAESPSNPCRDIVIRECSFSGHTDEIEVSPSDHATWYRDHIDKPAAIGVKFDRCIFGPSFINTGETIRDAAKRQAFLDAREYHNMSISASCCDGIEFNGCGFIGANRRSPQVAAKNAVMRHCVVDSWGSMAAAAHAGSYLSIDACHFLRGSRTSPLKRAVGLVEGTETSDFARLGFAVIAISANSREYNTTGTAIRSGWAMCHSPIGPFLRRAGVLNPSPDRTVSDIINKAGCGDQLDVNIRSMLSRGQRIDWIRDYTQQLPFPAVQ
jgi:hypothetical protein